ncbi:MAG TPA: methionine--tRNA ligase [Elusimicrobia bacterium]|nr:MAG: hypothetical protein A2016_07330 [Elusimicrobia bacterium GWF2_62_30]HBA61133.1 methionine--tRNA ligase [Elusimicrobiota bacterium]
MHTKKFYITTPLYSVEDKPHMGHAYTTLAADVLARHLRSRDITVFLQTGTGEHGAGIERTARERGMQPKAWCDAAAADFRALWKTLNVRYDNFLRTTDAAHQAAVQAVFEKLLAAGDIYRGVQDGPYCTACGDFHDEDGLKDGKCPVHGKPLERAREAAYFFRLSKYGPALQEHYAQHPDFLSPRPGASELDYLARAGLRDVPVSRTKAPWGVPVKSDPDHAVHSRFEELLGYATGPGFTPEGAGPDFNSIWPADVHLAGKESHRSQGVLWPALLLALGLELPRRVYAHGWLTMNGRKISRTRGNYIKAEDVVRDYGVDALRYFLFREVAFGSDGEFSMTAFHRRYNFDLANDLGDLFSRVTSMAAQYLDHRLPKRPEDSAVFRELASWTPELHRNMESLRFGAALEKIWLGLGRLNGLLDARKPLELAKKDPEALKAFLREMIWGLRLIAGWLDPFMPDTASRMQLQLGIGKTRTDGAEPREVPPLFPRK